MGRRSKYTRPLRKELEYLPSISNNLRLFYNKLSRVVRTLVSIKRLTFAQSLVKSVMDKLDPVREVLPQKDGDWEE